MKKNKEINRKLFTKIDAISAITDCNEFILVTNEQIDVCSEDKVGVLTLLTVLMSCLVKKGTLKVSDLELCIKEVKKIR